VDVDQLRSQFAQQRKGNGSVVDEREALAGRGDLARECRFAAVIQVVSVEECLQVPCSEIENAFDQAITFVVFQGGVVVLVPQQEAQRAEQDRLSGAGFARDDVQPVVQLQFEPVDQGVVFDFQTT